MAPPSHQQPATTFDPETKYRLLLRVHSAQELPHKSSQGAYCKLYVGATAMLDGGSQKSLTKGESTGDHDNNASLDDDHDEASSSHSQSHRVFRTQTKAAVKSETTWDETFEVSIRDPNTDVLSLRVKSQHRFYCPVIGTFAVYLHHLRVGHQADQWFPLRRGKKEAGKIRLHLLLTPEHVAHHGGGAIGRAKKKRNGSDMAADIKVALAANFEADTAIQRLVAKQLKDEEDRKLRRQRGEKSDDEDDESDNNLRSHDSAGVTRQLDVMAIAKVEPVLMGSGRGEVRFPVLLPPSPSAQNNSNTYRGDALVVTAAGSNNARRREGFTKLNQLETVAVVVKEGRHQGDAMMGSGRGSSSARYAVPGLVTSSTNSHISRSSPTSPLGQGGSQRSGVFGAEASLSSASATSGGGRMSEADRNRRRNEKFAHLKELDAAEPMGSGRGGSSRSSLPNTPSHNRSLNSPAVGTTTTDSARQNHALYSIPSFGPNDFSSQRSKRHSASSTDSDSVASAAEYERRIDRKLRKVRLETEKLRKIKNQLRKYIPDLTDSESDDAASSSSGSSAGEKHKSVHQQQKQSGQASTSSGRERYYV